LNKEVSRAKHGNGNPSYVWVDAKSVSFEEVVDFAEKEHAILHTVDLVIANSGFVVVYEMLETFVAPL
jgi:hypothetical protein